ncbi:MAG: alkaline phosphatase family protein [Thermoleophilia bacterium]|nr:alkaline phosphatase family protein [Thermoleophilia bacterium]
MSKLLVIGLDGGTFTVIDYLIGKNRLPNFARLIESGSHATLMSTLPPITPAAWSSFFTGTNPGKHGSVGFFRFREGTYQLEPMNAANVRGASVWGLVSGVGKRVCVYDVPVTYPAYEVNGVMISGMDAPHLDEKSTFPRTFREELLESVPDFAISSSVDSPYLLSHHPDPVGECIRQLRAHLDVELRTVRYLMEKEDWDMLVAVIRSPDSFQHIFWDSAEKVMRADPAADDEDRRRAESVFLCYEVLDSELGERWMRWGKDRNLLIMSDHGFGRLEKEICLNRVLAEAGLLHFHPVRTRQKARKYLMGKLQAHLPVRTRRGVRKLLGRDVSGRRWEIFVDALISDIDFSRTRIFSISQFGCLFVNTKGRYPSGTVAGEMERRLVIDETVAALEELADPGDGLPVLSRFDRKEEIYSGPLMEEMPDLVINMREYAYRGIHSTQLELAEPGIIREPMKKWGPLAHTGAHRREGILVMHGPDILPADLGQVQMVDVAPTIGALLDLPYPEDWDGRALTEAFRDKKGQPRAAEAISAAQEPGPGPSVYTEEEEDEVRRRLENLGYL